MDSIMVFIPAYRCASQIRRVIAQFTPDVAARFAEIVVIENRSPDDTLLAAKEALSSVSGCKVTLLQNNENYSLGGSHKVAFDYAIDHNHDYVVVLHGDDQGNIGDILPHIQNKNHEMYDCLLGSRFSQRSKRQGYSTFRTFGNYVFNAIVSVAVWRRISDLGSGLNMYNVPFLKSRFYIDFPDDLTFNVYMLYYYCKVNAEILFFAVSWKEDDQQSNAKVFKQAWNVLQLTFAYVFKSKDIFMALPPTARKYSFEAVYQREGFNNEVTS